MAESEVIETPRLRIQSFAAEHVTDRYVSWLADPEVVRFSEQRYRTHTLESCRGYFESFAGTDNFFWAVVSKDAALGHVGNMNAYVDSRHQIADVGILLGERTAWGKGIGTEAWVAILGYLLHSRAMRKITAGTLSTNTGMLRIMQRAGMVEDGRRHRHYMYDGSEVDIVHFAAFRGAWRAPA